MNDVIRVTGVEEVCLFLKSAPTLICVAGIGKALKAAGDVVLVALAQETPVQMVGSGEGEIRDLDAPHLITSLVFDLVMDSAGRGGYIQLGYGKLGYRAYFVEYGHHMVGHKPEKKDLGKDVPAHPFMRKAFEESVEAAIEAFAESLTESVRQWAAEGLQ